MKANERDIQTIHTRKEPAVMTRFAHPQPQASPAPQPPAAVTAQPLPLHFTILIDQITSLILSYNLLCQPVLARAESEADADAPGAQRRERAPPKRERP